MDDFLRMANRLSHELQQLEKQAGHRALVQILERAQVGIVKAVHKHQKESARSGKQMSLLVMPPPQND